MDEQDYDSETFGDLGNGLEGENVPNSEGQKGVRPADSYLHKERARGEYSVCQQKTLYGKICSSLQIIYTNYFWKRCTLTVILQFDIYLFSDLTRSKVPIIF